MRKYLVLIIICCFCNKISQAQERDIGIHHGRFYSPYKYIDYGTGYKNNQSSNYNFLPSFTFNKYYPKKISLEAAIFFTLYEQYFGTRKYYLAFESTYGAAHVALRLGYSLVKNRKLECRIKGGLSIGIAPDMYKGEWIEMFIHPYLDSISRGNIKRNFTPVFPMLSTGIDLSYKFSKRFKVSLAANYQQGFFKITEYDIYYNDGSGSNDQHARQWGNGTFYGAQLGVRYILKNKTGKK